MAGQREPLGDHLIAKMVADAEFAVNREGQLPDEMARDLGCHVLALDAELTRVAEQLCDCWLLLDAIARDVPDIRHQAVAILRKQQAPGWKEVTNAEQ